MPGSDWQAAVLIILQLIYLEGILSIDNAAVLGAMVSHLPREEPVPGRYVVVGLTALPAIEGGYRGEVAEVVVRG